MALSYSLLTSHFSLSCEAASPEAEPYLKQLDAKDAFVRQEAFVRLEALRDPATAPIVRQYLTSKYVETRAFAVRAVAAIEGVPAVPTLLERLKQERPTVRIAILLALEPLQKLDPSITPVLLAALRDRKPEVRMAAVDIVSRIIPPPVAAADGGSAQRAGPSGPVTGGGIKQPQAREAILTRWKRERHRDVRRVLELAMKRIGAL